MTILQTPGRHKRRGSAYITILGVGMIISTISLGSLIFLREQRKQIQLGRDYVQARLYAQSGLELAQLEMRGNTNWREDNVNGWWRLNESLDDGLLSVMVIDDDGDLADSVEDPVTLTAYGYAGTARSILRVTMLSKIDPIDALGTAIHSHTMSPISLAAILSLSGAPISANITLTNAGTIDGDAEASTIVNAGTITGTSTSGIRSKDLPSPDIFNRYVNMATVIIKKSVLQNIVLSPSVNPYGAANAEGMYVMATNNTNLYIRNLRLVGTLVLNVGTGTVIIDGPTLLQAASPNQPVLIVNGNLEFNFDSQTPLSEAVALANYNPAGAPYLNQTDADQSDVYPSMIQGLIHVRGAAYVNGNCYCKGALIAEGAVEINSNAQFTHNSELWTNPPDGYTKLPEMVVQYGTYQRVVE